MNYDIIYDAVRKKSRTIPPNLYIGNVEMAAGVGIVLGEAGLKLDYDNISTPEQLKENFLKVIENTDINSLSEEKRTIVDTICKYKVKEMVNENLQDLIYLTKREG